MTSPRNTAPGTQLDVAAGTDVGMEREVNQDRVGEGEVAGGHLLVVADGMGGHAAGEEAARIVVESIFRTFETESDEPPPKNLYDGMQIAHNDVLAYAKEHDTQGMGSTAVAAFIKDGQAFIAHVGDSRLYWLRDGEVKWRTRDHTRVAKMVEIGVLTEEQAKEHPDANVITRAIGHIPAEGPAEFAADVLGAPAEVCPNDTLLLCSDGLFDLVEDREMIELVAHRSPKAGVEALINLANSRGGHDNTSVIVAHFGLGTSPPPKEPSHQIAAAGTEPEPEGEVLRLSNPDGVASESPGAVMADSELPSRPELEVDKAPPTRSALPTSPGVRVPSDRLADEVHRQRLLIALLAFLVIGLSGAVAWLVTRGGSGPVADEPSDEEQAPIESDDDSSSAEQNEDASDDDSSSPEPSEDAADDDSSTPSPDEAPSPAPVSGEFAPDPWSEPEPELETTGTEDPVP